jgi:transposase
MSKDAHNLPQATQTPRTLPDDPAILKAMLQQREEQIAEQNIKLATLTEHNIKLTERTDELESALIRAKHQLQRFKRWYYGPRADQLTVPDDVAQLVLEFAEHLQALPPPQIEDTQAISADAPPPEVAELPGVDLATVRKVSKGTSGGGGRRNLAQWDELPTIRKEYDLADEQKACPCCHALRTQIGQETSWQIEYVPGHFERIEHVRFKYACAACEQEAVNPNIQLATKLRQPIEKGMPGPGLLAFITTAKFADFLPLYRLEDGFDRCGFSISRATMSVWCGDVADLLGPLYDLMVKRVLGSQVICTDDTTMPMLAPGKGKTQTARMWVYVGDENNPYDVFDFTLSRNRDGPLKFLKGFHQILLADGYAGYNPIVAGNDLVRAGCMAHCRRKFVEAEKTHPQIAREAVEWIRKLYEIEHRAKTLSVGERTRMRMEKSKPILDQLYQRLSLWKLQLLPKHPMSDAVNYALNQWKELNTFVKDGAVPIDNNISEREMKRIVLNRKSSLFVGNERGGRTAAILSSFTSTCRRHEIDPQRYLTQLLTNLPDTKSSQLDQWLPDQWKKLNGEPMPDARV